MTPCMSTTHASDTATTAHPRRWAALGLLAVAQFVLILDITVATVARRTRPENVAARRTAERVGFVDEGTVPGDTTMQLLRYRAADAMPHGEQERATSYRVMGGSTCLHL